MLSISIVTYNSADVIAECLNAIAAATTNIAHEIIVIDNASSDETCKIIRDGFPHVKLIANEQNLGFGAGHNRGFRESAGDYSAIINPDLIATPGLFTTLIDYMENNPDVGIVGPRIYAGDGTVNVSARPDYTPLRVLSIYLGLTRWWPALAYGEFSEWVKTATEPIEAGWLSGACLLIRQEAYAQIGGFDEDFFLFTEDTDICIRANDAGWKIMFHPCVQARHYLSTSVRKAKLISTRHYHLSPLIYFRKRRNRGAVWLLKAGFALELMIKTLRRMLRASIRDDARIHFTVLREVIRF